MPSRLFAVIGASLMLGMLAALVLVPGARERLFRPVSRDRG